MKNNLELFTIWLTDKDCGYMPFYCELCTASMQVFNEKVVIYTNHKLKLNFLSSKITEIRYIQDYFPGLLEKVEELTKNTPTEYKMAHMSDYIRAYILTKQNGIYLDSDVLLLKSLPNFQKYKKSIILGKEDEVRVANGFLCRVDKGGIEYFQDIIDMYDTSYVSNSRTFNSMRYLLLLNRRYADKVKVFEPQEGFFYPTWEGKDEDIQKLMEQNKDIQPLEGFGTHLYKTEGNWKELLKCIDEHCYDKNGIFSEWYVIRAIQYVISKYIEMMVQKGEIKNVK